MAKLPTVTIHPNRVEIDGVDLPSLTEVGFTKSQL